MTYIELYKEPNENVPGFKYKGSKDRAKNAANASRKYTGKKKILEAMKKRVK